jgi:RNA polymerase sigma-70 factor (ECF subfamily)
MDSLRLFAQFKPPIGAANTPPEEDPAVVALVNRVVRSRDQHAFAELYDRYLDRVYRYLYYRVGSHETPKT